MTTTVTTRTPTRSTSGNTSMNSSSSSLTATIDVEDDNDDDEGFEIIGFRPGNSLNALKRKRDALLAARERRRTLASSTNLEIIDLTGDDLGDEANQRPRPPKRQRLRPDPPQTNTSSSAVEALNRQTRTLSLEPSSARARDDPPPEDGCDNVDPPEVDSETEVDFRLDIGDASTPRLPSLRAIAPPDSFAEWFAEADHGCPEPFLAEDVLHERLDHRLLAAKAHQAIQRQSYMPFPTLRQHSHSLRSSVTPLQSRIQTLSRYQATPRDQLARLEMVRAAKPFNTFRTCGAVGRIVQCGAQAALCSSVPYGGSSDVLDSESIGMESENVPGALTWRTCSPLTRQNSLPGRGPWECIDTHCKPYNTPQQAEQSHYFSILDTAFNPHSFGPVQLVTTGNDGTINYWKSSEPSTESRPFSGRASDYSNQLPTSSIAPAFSLDLADTDTDSLGARAQSLGFNPDPNHHALFSAAYTNDGTVCIYGVNSASDPSDWTEHLAIQISDGKISGVNRFDVSGQVWGRNLSKNHLFAGTCSSDEQLVGNAVKVIQLHEAVVAGPVPFQEEHNNVQSLALDPTGAQLAVVANNVHNHQMTVSLYDVRCKRVPWFLFEANLHPTTSSPSPTPSPSKKKTRSDLSNQRSDDRFLGALSAQYSADGVYLAVARENNTAQVFDVRFPNSEIFSCAHQKPDLHTGLSGGMGRKPEQWGIAAMDWFDHTVPSQYGHWSPNVLLTGGDDGCVRRWDLRRAIEDSGEVLVQMPAGVCSLSCGDTYKGESTFIVGDAEGLVYEYEEFTG